MKLLDDIIQQFCSTDELRPLMCSPWEHNGNIIATDAHVLVVAPKLYFCKEYDNDSLNKRPHYQAVIPAHEKTPFHSINTQSILDELLCLQTVDYYHKCEKCEGYGYTTTQGTGKKVDCDECDDGNLSFIGTLIPSVGYDDDDDERDLCFTVRLGEVNFDPNLFLKICRLAAHLGIATIDFVIAKKGAVSIIYINDIMVLLMPFVDIEDSEVCAIELEDFFHQIKN